MKTLNKIYAIIFGLLVFNNADAKICVRQMKTFSNKYLLFQPTENFKNNLVKEIVLDSLNILKKKYPAVYKNLIREFSNAGNIKYTVEGKILYAFFNSNRHKVSAVYSLNGYNKYSITNLGTELPKNITEKIKTEYPAYTIFFGREIKADNETVYQVIIENRYGYRVINFLNEEIGEVKKIKKQF
jgi:hypothetical protein